MDSPKAIETKTIDQLIHCLDRSDLIATWLSRALLRIRTTMVERASQIAADPDILLECAREFAAPLSQTVPEFLESQSEIRAKIGPNLSELRTAAKHYPTSFDEAARVLKRRSDELSAWFVLGKPSEEIREEQHWVGALVLNCGDDVANQQQFWRKESKRPTDTLQRQLLVERDWIESPSPQEPTSLRVSRNHLVGPSVSLDPPQITIAGKPYSLTLNAAEYLHELITCRDWMSDPEYMNRKPHIGDNFRFDRLSLPEAVRSRIETDRRKGKKWIG